MKCRLVNENFKSDYVNNLLKARGIKDIDTANDMINAGATRIGTSSGVELMNNECHCHCHDCDCKEDK